MGFNQYYTYQFDVAGYRRICKGYELYFNGELVGYEPTWGMGSGIDNCIWNLANNPASHPTCFFNEVDITAYARAVQGAPTTSVHVFEYDKRTVYPLPFGPSATRCQAIGAAAGSNMFACFVGNTRAY